MFIGEPQPVGDHFEEHFTNKNAGKHLVSDFGYFDEWISVVKNRVLDGKDDAISLACDMSPQDQTEQTYREDVTKESSRAMKNALGQHISIKAYHGHSDDKVLKRGTFFRQKDAPSSKSHLVGENTTRRFGKKLLWTHGLVRSLRLVQCILSELNATKKSSDPMKKHIACA